MSSIAAGTTSGSALVSTGDTTGNLVLQVNGTTPSVSLAANGSIGVGSTPAYGTSGQVLTSSGTGSAPTWSTPATGAMTFLQSVTAASSATVELTALTSTYDMYMVVGSGVTSTTLDASLRLRMEVSGAFQSTGYKSNSIYTNSGSTTFGNENAETAQILVSRFNMSSLGLNFVLYLGVPSSTTLYKPVTWQVFGFVPSTTMYQIGSGAYVNSTAAVTKIQFSPSSSTIASGTFRLYGISNS